MNLILNWGKYFQFFILIASIQYQAIEAVYQIGSTGMKSIYKTHK